MILGSSRLCGLYFLWTYQYNGDVLMCAMDCIGMQEGVDVPSILAIVETHGFEGPEGNRIVFADCGLNPEPGAEELASIAIASADNTKALMGWEPRTAFYLSQPGGSGTAGSVDKILEALKIAKERRPDLKIDGEFQLDTAIDPEVAAKKLGPSIRCCRKSKCFNFPGTECSQYSSKTCSEICTWFCIWTYTFRICKTGCRFFQRSNC